VAATRAESGEGPLHRYDCDLHVPRVLRAEVALLKAVALRYVMADPSRRSIQTREQEMLTELVQVMSDRGPDALDALFAQYYQDAADDDARLRVVLDQVSLLTDAQAVARHRRLVG
jgi:dGTPase